jgi:predicted dehydrogenase
MARKIYKVAIAGCGKVAHLHARAIRGISNAVLAAVWSRTPGSAEEFAARYDCQSYRDITSMVLESQIDIVIVCTPHPFHKQPAV